MAEGAHAYAIGGQKTKALQLLAELLAKSVHIPQYYLAVVYAGLGDCDRSFGALGRAYKEKELELIWFKPEPRFDFIAQDARYYALLRRMRH